MILWGKRAKTLLDDVERQGQEIAGLKDIVEAQGRELARLITEAKQPEGTSVVSVASQEGEPWLKRKS